MLALHGVALSLLLSWGPTNGFDPTSVYVLRQGLQYAVDGAQSARFDKWLNVDPGSRAPAVRYFVACAFEEGVVIRHGTYRWSGAFGLAPSLASTLASLAPLPPAGPAQAPLGARPGSPPPAPTKPPPKSVQLVPTADDGKWVSACLMALSNMANSHQYVLLRGNPPAWKAGPSEAELWTMGYPEGVFFADLLNYNVKKEGAAFLPVTPPRPPTREDLERSYTLSLNLPDDFVPTPPWDWAPPNASNGRSLDFHAVQHGTVDPVGRYRVAEKLGTYDAEKAKLEPMTGKDPVYGADLVCVAARPSPVGPHSSHPGAIPAPAGLQPATPATRIPPHVPLEVPRQVVDCQTPGAERLHPLFVMTPRVVDFSSATSAVNAALIIQAIDVGDVPLKGPADQGQWRACQAGVTCTGPVRLISPGDTPTAAAGTAARSLVGLGAKQAVLVVLRREPSTKPDPLDPRTERFTAIIRYRAKGEGSARIEVSDLGGGMRVVDQPWPATSDWSWMQVYPVYAVADPAHGGGRLALKVQVSGPSTGNSNLDLDIAGFVSGPPWCLDSVGGCFAGTCPDDEKVVPLVRRAGSLAKPRWGP